MSHIGNCQVGRQAKPNPWEFHHREPIETFQDLVIALQKAFNHGFDEGPHWAQVGTYE